jgi:hypothetical protein
LSSLLTKPVRNSDAPTPTKSVTFVAEHPTNGGTTALVATEPTPTLLDDLMASTTTTPPMGASTSAPASHNKPNDSIVVIPGPPKMLGWLRKQGHIIRNWKTRYFVLNNGFLTYYVEKLDTPPFGRQAKGQLCLAGFRIVPLKPGDVSARIHLHFDPMLLNPAFVAYLRENGSQPGESGSATPGDSEAHAEDLILETSNDDERTAWVAALEMHTLYIETAAQNAFQRKAQQTGEQESPTELHDSDSDSDALVFQFQSAGDFTQEQQNAVIDNNSATALSERGREQEERRLSFSTMSTTSKDKRNPKAVRSSLTSVNSQKWTVFLNRYEDIVLHGIISKPNPLGIIHLIRELVLVRSDIEAISDKSTPFVLKRLLYIDTNSYEMKGEIVWKSDASSFPKVSKVGTVLLLCCKVVS